MIRYASLMVFLACGSGSSFQDAGIIDAPLAVVDSGRPMRPDAAPGTSDVAVDFDQLGTAESPWSFAHGTTEIAVPVIDWAGLVSQSAFAVSATGNTHIPAMMRVASTTMGNELEPGDIAIHSQDDTNGAGLGPARLVWTSPQAGTVSVAGSIWLGRTTFGRSNNWTLTVAGNQVAMGTLASDDGRSRTNPVLFSEAAQTSLAAIPVAEGDEVVLEIVRNTPTGEFTGLRLTVIVAP